MTDPDPAPAQVPEDTITTRDRVWGVVVVVGGTVLVIALALWWLGSMSQCGTRPPSGYDDASGARPSCQSIDARRLVAGDLRDHES